MKSDHLFAEHKLNNKCCKEVPLKAIVPGWQSLATQCHVYADRLVLLVNKNQQKQLGCRDQRFQHRWILLDFWQCEIPIVYFCFLRGIFLKHLKRTTKLFCFAFLPLAPYLRCFTWPTMGGGGVASKIQLCSKREEWTIFFFLARQSQWGIGGTYTYSNLHITLRNWMTKQSI